MSINEDSSALFVLEDAIYNAYSDQDPFVQSEREEEEKQRSEAQTAADKMQSDAENLLAQIRKYDKVCKQKNRLLSQYDDLLNKRAKSALEKRGKFDEAIKALKEDLYKQSTDLANLGNDICAYGSDCSYGAAFMTVDQARNWAYQHEHEVADFESDINALKEDTQSIICGQIDSPLRYDRNSALRRWLFGYDTFAWRFLNQAIMEDTIGLDKDDFRVEKVLPRTLARIFGNPSPECLYTLKVSDSTITRLADKSKNDVANMFLDACLPRLGCGTPNNIPPRLNSDYSVNHKDLDTSFAGRCIISEIKFYADLERNPDSTQFDEQEWKLRCFKRMLPILILTGTNPLFDLSVWNSPELFTRITEWMATYYGKTTSDYEPVVLQSFARTQSPTPDHNQDWMLGDKSIPWYYEQAYGQSTPMEEDLRSTASWEKFPAAIRAKAELIYNTLVCAAMSDTKWLLRDAQQIYNTPEFSTGCKGETAQSAAAPAHQDIKKVHPSCLVLAPDESALLIVDAYGKDGKRATEVIGHLSLSPDTWQEKVFCRTQEDVKRKLSTNSNDYQIASLEPIFTEGIWHGAGKCPDSGLHAIIFAGSTEDQPEPELLYLSDENSTNGTSVVRDGVHYVIGAGKKGKRADFEAILAKRLGHDAPVVDKSGEPFALQRGDRIYLALNPQPELTASYIIL